MGRLDREHLLEWASEQEKEGYTGFARQLLDSAVFAEEEAVAVLESGQKNKSS